MVDSKKVVDYRRGFWNARKKKKNDAPINAGDKNDKEFARRNETQSAIIFEKASLVKDTGRYLYSLLEVQQQQHESFWIEKKFDENYKRIIIGARWNFT